MGFVLAVGVTFAVILLVLNLGSGEKKIKHKEDRKKTHRVTLEEWMHRPLSEKILEHAAGLLRSQL